LIRQDRSQGAEIFPVCSMIAAAATVRSFRDFDGLYTAPLHGFRDAEDYWGES
jgi:predicted alpha/beta-fold hydrolase